MADQSKSVLIADDMCVTDVNFKKCTYLWVINHFKSVHIERKHTIKSKPFSASDDKFKWLLYLHYTYNNRNQSLISLQLYPDADFSEHIPITGTLKSSIVKSDNQKANITNTKFNLCLTSGTNFVDVSYFVDIDKLLNSDNGLLPDGRLTIYCELSYVKATDIVNISAEPFSKSFEENEPSCLEGIEFLLLKKEFSDVTLIVEGENYPAHKSILVCRSSVFRAVFTHNMVENQSNSMVIKDIKVPVFKEMLRFIYTGKVENMQKLAPQLLAAADRYDLEKLKIMCEKELYSTLYSGTAVSTLILADLYHADNLKKQALLFIKIHSYTLNKEEQKSLLQSHPHLLVEIINVFSKSN